MPNHCNNHLTVIGDSKEVLRFIETVTVDVDGDKKISIFRTIVPCPTELSDTMCGSYGNDEHGNKKPEQVALEAKQEANIAKYGHKDWYDWCIENWGTKWGDYNTDGGTAFETNSGASMVAEYTYDTAWTPALEGLKKVSGEFPMLRFINTYSEEGMGFLGCATFHNGDMLSSVDQDVPDMPDYDESDSDAMFDAFDQHSVLVADALADLYDQHFSTYVPAEHRSA